ncbi:MAG: F0F1 ATP synthase subunit B [Anaerolineales bacterium]|nr:F0F1 ATP synthase subunit B [Anaerolineales bacterium]MDW8227646.1 F0F1 ATP synthase subunit B [Anaerolineales bacterium]
MDKLGLNLGFFLFQIFNFTVMAILLYAWAYKPIVRSLEKRREKIAQGLEDARIAAEARANAEKEAAKIIADAQAKAAQIVRDATERAEQAAKDVRAAAEAEIAKARENALAEAEGERNRMLSDLRGQIAALAIAATQKLIGEALDEKRQHALINEFFSGVKAGKVVVLESAEVRGASAEVISALPLTAEEEETVRRDILAKIGAQAVTFRVDPKILGGLVIKVGDKVLDGSVAAQIEGLRQALK